MSAGKRSPESRTGRAVFHQLPEAVLDALVRGDGDGDAAGELLNAERSRRLLLLRALLDLADEQAPLADAWALLERAQLRAPDAVEELLTAPGTGIWLSHALRGLRGRPAEDAPSWVTAGHLSALAAAAATRAGIGFAVTVPVRDGHVPLPTLGCALLPAGEKWGTARVTGRDGRLRITGARGEVDVAPGRYRQPGWIPLRRITVGPAGRQLTLAVDEFDPYRSYLRTSPPRVLSEAEATAWHRYLGEAWSILLRDEPVAAAAMRRGLLSLTPTGRSEPFRTYSSSAGDAFGGFNASLPDGSSYLAAIMVHEFQHIKLGGLMHVHPLLRPATPEESERPELFHAPWRDDPRPLEGLLQGVYAFFGVTRFWRTHRHTIDPAQAPAAHFEYVFWRDQLLATLDTVRDHERLTPLGRRILATLGEHCAQWTEDDVPAEIAWRARELAADHLARWREHHLRPAAGAVDESVRAWRRGDPRPPVALAAEPALVPDPRAGFLDVAAVLARHVLTAGGESLEKTPEGGVSGAEATDVLLAHGDRAAALPEVRSRLRTGQATVGTWAVLGRTLVGDPAHGAASRLLCRFPERARAVHDALRAAGARPVDPVELADWLGGEGRG